MKADYLLRQNIKALLEARHQTAHELAIWCRRTDAWISRVLSGQGQRGVPLKYFDRIADFFGIATYQLFQPGISPLHERRKNERRKTADRRVSRLVDMLREPPRHAEIDAKLRALEPDNYRKVARWIDAMLLAQDHPQDTGGSVDRTERAAPQSPPARRTRAPRRA